MMPISNMMRMGKLNANSTSTAPSLLPGRRQVRRALADRAGRSTRGGFLFPNIFSMRAVWHANSNVFLAAPQVDIAQIPHLLWRYGAGQPGGMRGDEQVLARRYRHIS
jgi:hypothetical protein